MQIDFHHQVMLYLGLYERELEKYFKAMIRPGYSCFDVGGSGGYDALLLAKLSDGGRVISFEADESAARIMRDTFSRNRFDISTIVGYVGRNAGLVRLDDIAREYFIPDFIKIDIEGAESDALEGACDILQERMPGMVIEVHGITEENKCLALLERHGYKVKIVNQRQWLTEHRPLKHNRWLICEGK